MKTAQQFILELEKLRSDSDLGNVEKYFKGNDGQTKALGVRFGNIFALAQEYWDMPLGEIGKLLDSDYYEIRMAAVSIMDFQAKNKKTSPETRRELYELYLQRHDRLNNWDLVDRGAYNIIGEYLLDKPRSILYELAKSVSPWERRTAIVATYAFIKKNQVEETFRIAEILIHDSNDLVNKAVGGWIREAGKRDEEKLLAFLEKYAATMPRVTLRYAIEKLDPARREKYLKAKQT
ncbi:DNA alkylation repair protein [Algoriphagus terrigena]|uniref:DNA alkylation repair protein n=1 Tax=Algoriphagus terrigena TaxID=344884 RepID=UPI000424296B|nr:DNA alkylation repair protein [Algoriphagus terrigena]